MMIVDDDFLTPEEVQHYQDTIFDPRIPWILTRELVARDFDFNLDKPKYRGSQFNHILFHEWKQRSAVWDEALDILIKFCIKHNIMVYAIMRGKMNLTFPDPDVDVEETVAAHTDHQFPHYVFLYYVNDADGDTILYNEKFDNSKRQTLTELQRVHPKAGRAILFDGEHIHSPLTPTDGYRVVMNITFIGAQGDI